MKDQIKSTIAKKLLVKLGSRMRTDVDYGWRQVKAAVQGAADEDKEQIIRMLMSTTLLQAHLNTLADAEADVMLADDNLSLAELFKIL